MEYWDLYDKDKNKLNKIVKRGDYLIHINEMLNVSELLKKGYNIPKLKRKKEQNYARENEIK